MPAVEIVKGAASTYSCFVAFLGSSFLRDAYVVAGDVMLRMSRCVRCLRCACVACMLLVGCAHACLRWVLFFSVRLVIFGVARLVLSCLLLLSSVPLFLPLSASASGKTDTLIAEIWGGHLVYQASSLCFSLMGLGLYAVGLCLV